MRHGQSLVICGRADGLHDAMWHEDGKIWTSHRLDNWHAGAVASIGVRHHVRWEHVDWFFVATRSILEPEERTVTEHNAAVDDWVKGSYHGEPFIEMARPDCSIEYQRRSDLERAEAGYVILERRDENGDVDHGI